MPNIKSMQNWEKEWRERFCKEHVILNDKEQIAFISRTIEQALKEYKEEVVKLVEGRKKTNRGIGFSLYDEQVNQALTDILTALSKEKKSDY